MADNPALQHKAVASQVQTFTSATTGTGPAIDARGYTFATFFVNLGTTTGTSATVDVKIQSDDNSGFSSATDVTGAAITQVTAAESADNTIRVLVVDLKRVSERYIRSHVTTGGTVTSIPISVQCLLSNGPIQPLKSDYADYDANF